MAAVKDNLPSLGYLAGTNTFTKQRGHGQKNSDYRPTALQDDASARHNRQRPDTRAALLWRRLQQLKERELMSRQHNRELLLQFDKAQDILEDLLVRNDAMKMIRIEYERHVEDWQQAAQRERMEGRLKMCLKTEEMKSCGEGHQLFSQGSNKSQITASPNHSSRNQDQTTCMQFSRLTHPQYRVPCQLQSSLQVPSPLSSCTVIPHHHPFSSHPSNHHSWTLQDKPSRDYTDTLSSRSAVAAENVSGHEVLFGPEQPPPGWGKAQTVGEEAERSPKSQSGGGSRCRHLSQELDIKPVSLSSGHADSSESGVDSLQVNRGKRGRSQCTSSEEEQLSSKQSSGTSSAVVTTATRVGQRSDTDNSQRGSDRRSTGVTVELVRTAACERTKTRGAQVRSHRESSGEESGSQPSERTRKQSPESKNAAPEDAAADKAEEESGNSERSAREKEERHKNELEKLGDEDTEEEESRQQDEEGGSSEDVSITETAAGEEEEKGVDDTEVESEEEGDEGGKEAKQACESGDESELSEDKSDERPEFEREKQSANLDDEEVEENEEQRSTNAAEEEEEERTDTEDSIIAPHENRAKKIHTIPEEEEPVEEDEDASQTGNPSEDSNGDIEELLAPQAQTQQQAKDQKTEGKPQVIHKDLENLSVLDSVKTSDHRSDSDESEHFYD